MKKILVFFILLPAFINAAFEQTQTGEEKRQVGKCYIPKSCPVSLPQDATNACVQERKEAIKLARKWYRLTVEGEKKTIDFPFTFIPWLNQTRRDVSLHTALDAFEARWGSSIQTLKAFVDELGRVLAMKTNGSLFYTIAEYEAVYRSFNEAVKSLHIPYYMSNPIYGAISNRIIDSNFWKTDDFFVQKRFSGPCPFLLRKVTADGNIGLHKDKFLQQLNRKFDWDAAVGHVFGEKISLDHAISDERVFVLYNEEHNDLPTLPDQNDVNPHDTRRLLNVTSPITVFVRNTDDELKVIAIQWDYRSNSPVYSPNSKADDWLLAKGMVESSETNICQAMYHLAHVHFASTVYCTVFRRHFSPRHPLYDVMKYHCEGTTPHISVSYPILAAPNQPGHLYINVGHLGFGKLSVTGYQQHFYGILNYDETLKSRGLDDPKLKYYPFRDDGGVLWREFQRFAEQFVNLYYKKDKDVKKDQELQGLANELSEDGNVAPDGGKGKVKKFPKSFTSKKELQKFIYTFLWINAFHTAVNYPVEPFNTFIPLSATKLYKDFKPNARTTYGQALPDAPTTFGIAAFGTLLGNMRLNRIMDYYDSVQDPQLRKLVRKTYVRLHTCVQQLLEKRNAERSSKNLLGFPYFEPKWLPNSIHV